MFGNDSHHKEICIRITCELAVNKQKYLSPDYVVKGACLELTVKRLYHSTTSQRDLKQAYKLEVMASATDSKQVGPWQILAAANVLHRQIHSVYPNLGSSVVQREVKCFNVLHRQIHCVSQSGQQRSPEGGEQSVLL